MNERNTLLHKYFPLVLFSKRSYSYCSLRDRRRDIYSETGLLLSISSSMNQGLPTPPHLASRDTSDWLRIPRSTPILCTLSKSDQVVLITWSSSDYTSVVNNRPDV